MKEWTSGFLFTIMIITILRLFSPSEKYDKYINLFTSMVILIAIISPILNFFNMHSFDEILGLNTFYFDTLSEEVKYKTSEKYTQNLIITEFENKLDSHLEDILKQKFNEELNVKITINKDDNEIDYSSIEKIEITSMQNSSIKETQIKKYLNETYLFNKNNIYFNKESR